MDEMHNPPHPGLTLRDDVLPALGLKVGEAAAQLGVDRTTLSKVLNGRGAISPAMALRIERWLGRDRGGAATAYDLWQAKLALKKSKTLQGVKSAAKRAA
jgi:addiction module HigA family antidote